PSTRPPTPTASRSRLPPQKRTQRTPRTTATTQKPAAPPLGKECDMPRQLIHLAGGLAVVLVLVLGVTAGFLPLYSQSQTTHGDAARVPKTNDMYQAQLYALQVQQQTLGALQESLEELQRQIPSLPYNDQVFEAVLTAANAAGVEITEIEGEPADSLPRF